MMDAVCGQEKKGDSSTQALKNSRIQGVTWARKTRFFGRKISEGSSLCLLLTWAVHQREGKVA